MNVTVLFKIYGSLMLFGFLGAIAPLLSPDDQYTVVFGQLWRGWLAAVTTIAISLASGIFGIGVLRRWIAARRYILFMNAYALINTAILLTQPRLSYFLVGRSIDIDMIRALQIASILWYAAVIALFSGKHAALYFGESKQVTGIDKQGIKPYQYRENNERTISRLRQDVGVAIADNRLGTAARIIEQLTAINAGDVVAGMEKERLGQLESHRDEVVAAAEHELESGRYDAAAKLYGQAAAIDSDNEVIQQRISDIEVVRKLHADLERALASHHPRRVIALGEKALSLLHEGALFRPPIERARANLTQAAACKVKGVEALDRGDHQEASAQAELALALDNEDKEARDLLGRSGTSAKELENVIARITVAREQGRWRDAARMVRKLPPAARDIALVNAVFAEERVMRRKFRRRAAFGLAVAIACVLLLASGGWLRTRAHLKKARNAFASGDLQAAVEILQDRPSLPSILCAGWEDVEQDVHGNLVQEAERLIGEKKLTTPPDENAFDLVLLGERLWGRRNATNRLREQMADMYMSWAYAKLRVGANQDAQLYFDNAERVWPSSRYKARNKRQESEEAVIREILYFASQVDHNGRDEGIPSFDSTENKLSIKHTSNRGYDIWDWYTLDWLGDPDNDGRLEASITWRNSEAHGASGWSEHWGIVEHSDSRNRKEEWGAQVLSSARRWCEENYPGAQRAFPVAILLENTIKVSVCAFYPGDANCCPRYRNKLSFTFGEDGSPALTGKYAGADREAETDCRPFTSDFSAGIAGWEDQRSGPGLSRGVVDTRNGILHLDSRAGSNYYLDYTKVIDVPGCLADATVSWYWRIDQIESPYGLAQVILSFYGSGGAYLGEFRVWRHTGKFDQYGPRSIVRRWPQEQPGKALKVESVVGTRFSGDRYSVVLNASFFASFDVLTIEPNKVTSMKILLRSYNNAGSGVNMWYDDVTYQPKGVVGRTSQ